MSSSGEDDRAWFVDVPLPLVALAVDHTSAVSAPTMADNIEAERRGPAKIGLEGQCFLLFMNATQNPLNRQGPRPEFQCDMGVLEAAGGELQAGMETKATEPSELDDTAFTRARRLHPAKGLGPAAPVVGGEKEVPTPDGYNGATNAND